MKAGKKIRILAATAAVLLAGAFGVHAAMRNFKSTGKQIPTARVMRGDLEIRVFATGELRATKSMSMMAPSVGGALQIIKLAKTGTRVKPGDPVIAFDPSEQQYKLEQARSELAEAEQQIVKSNADAAVSVSSPMRFAARFPSAFAI